MPEWTEPIRLRLASLRLDPVREREIVEELAQHLDERYEELRQQGHADDEAQRLAAAELLAPDVLAGGLRALRQAKVTPLPAPGVAARVSLRGSWQDVRLAGRAVRRQPVFALAVVLTLALGIGVNGAIFALVDATILRPLPLPDPDRVVMLWERTERVPRGRVSPRNLLDWQARTGSLDRIAGFTPGVGGMVIGGRDGMTETVSRQWVTAGFFDVLGIEPIAGRTFRDDDDRQDGRVVVLSEGFWRARFNADLGLVGRELHLDGDPYTVVGVVPDAAQVLARTSLWALVPISRASERARTAYVFHSIGRLRPGVEPAAAADDLTRVAASLARELPATNAGRGIALAPLSAAVIGSELRETSLLFLGVVGFVLLICCANIVNLLLARATGRARELAIRVTLGADRWRVARQLLTESLVLAGLGGALGLAIGAAILRAAPGLIPAGLLPPTMVLAFDGRVVAFCAVAALVVGVLVGLAPAWQAARLAPAAALSAEGRTTTGSGGRVRRLLVGVEVATAVALLFGAGLLLRTLLVVDGVDRGYRAEGVLTMVVDPLGDRYPTPSALVQFYDAVGDEVRAVPGVRAVGWASTLPFGPSYAGRTPFAIEGAPLARESDRPTADYQIVSPAYFSALDLPVLAGRGFDERDRRDSPPVCMVNEAFVRRHLEGRSPIGVRVVIPSGDAAQPPVIREIVGVARQVKGRPDETEELLQIYVPLAQDPTDDMFLLVRPASGEAQALTPAVRAAIGRVDREQLVSVRGTMTLEDVVWEATARHRFRAVLVIGFAALAVALAMVGLFGVLAYAVERQRRDFGVRRALGGSAIDILRPVVGSALRMVGGGAVVGLAGSIVAGRLLDGMLFGVRPLDPATIAGVIGMLVLTAVAAIAGPAWRALRVDPATALRGE